MEIDNKQHIKFYETEIKSIEYEWTTYLNKKMRILIGEKALFIGRVWAILEKSGTVIIRFRNDMVPRLNTPYYMRVVGKEATGDPLYWEFTYKDFIYSDKNYWNGKGSEAVALDYQKNQSEWVFLSISVSDLKLFEYLEKECLNNGRQTLVVVAENDPPLNYLRNLKEFVETVNENHILQSDVTLKEKDWKPRGLNNEKDVTDQILEMISEQKITAIQGPPGTGKSYYAAKISHRLLDQNKSVAVCALTNKALIELSGQSPLDKSLKAGKVFKTTLSKDEIVRQPTLLLADSFTPTQGNLLLTTYYKLSKQVKELALSPKRYDLLIIEEASQAFLATIAMFSRIAERVLIIGDHKQLPPVVITNPKILSKIDANIYSVINGLETYLLNNEDQSYRFTKTRRLTKESSELTGIFYDNQLSSISPLNGKITHSSDIKDLFHNNGGITIARLSQAGKNSISQTEVLDGISRIANKIFDFRKEDTVALISFTVNVEKRITSSISKHKPDYSRLTISTVHKVQGHTADYAIYLMPLTNPNFELDLNLFNVAASRAKKGTLIVTYNHLSMLVGLAPEVLQFLNGAEDVTDYFMERHFKTINN